MSWKLKQKAQLLLAAEQGTVYRDWGGRVSIALVYPNTYAVGMSNLGFQTIYRHLNALPDVVCERVFLPDPEDIGELERTEAVPISLESFRPLTDFHMVGFSVTYEGDYVNVLRLLALARIPLRPEDRRPHDPLVLMGGVWPWLPVLSGGSGLPSGAAPERRRPPRDRGPRGRERREACGARRRVRLGLPVDRRAAEDRRGPRARALDLVDPGRQPDGRPRRRARPRRPPHADRRAGSGDGASPPGDPQGDHRRADSGRVRPGPRARDPEPQDLLHDRPADGDARGRGGDSAPRRTDARAPLRARPEGQAVRPLDALDLVLQIGRAHV